MSKVRLAALLLAAGLAGTGLAQGAAARPAGPDAARCESGHGPALLVRVTGFKVRTGTIRVQSYGGDPEHWFDKGSYLKRIELPVPAAGALDVCVPVPAPGEYAVSVRHDVNGSGKSDRGDGGGMSGNPELSLFDLMLKRHPDPAQVAVSVRDGVRTVPITLAYLSGTRFRPITPQER
ncbi:DUF2141 domain-containing protein [Sphingomonas morindae]|uniref:DUF2141 domain-containing protein n=1 Tax=Sphingomonas morindae TaxID=1541170 RepID=A0ABY4X8F1_9SPHN|nr:DUF2141 domain-containing protein [Sphingomonas morindae]USI73196.1 DUF2141 domain-containing protein [Sphingomonas morindae]